MMRTHAAKSVSGVRQLRRSATQPAMGPGRDDGMVVLRYRWFLHGCRPCGRRLSAGEAPSARVPPSPTRGRRRRATHSARFETAAPIDGTVEEQR